MWSKRDAARTLALATVFLVVALLLFPPVSWPSTPRDADRIAWYLKGQSDALFAGRGWTVEHLACTPRPDAWVACTIRVNVSGRGVYCDHAVYRIKGFGITGHASKPRRCGAPSS